MNFIFFKLLLPWRFFRIVGMIDGKACWSCPIYFLGVQSPENMLRCVNNNYSFSGFWRFVLWPVLAWLMICLMFRGWHSSFNKWTVRFVGCLPRSFHWCAFFWSSFLQIHVHSDGRQAYPDIQSLGDFLFHWPLAWPWMEVWLTIVKYQSSLRTSCGYIIVFPLRWVAWALFNCLFFSLEIVVLKFFAQPQVCYPALLDILTELSFHRSVPLTCGTIFRLFQGL